MIAFALLFAVLSCHFASGLTPHEIVELQKAGLKLDFTEGNSITISSTGVPSTLQDKRHQGAKEYNLRFQIHRYPTKLADGSQICLSDGIIGLSIDGTPIHNPYTKDCCNAGYERRNVMDACWGKLDNRNHYYYDVPPLCAFKNQCNTSTLIGVALDGFPIYGPYDTIGRYIEGLDECNGKDDPFGGYRYHISEEFPYMMGCFRSNPLSPSRCGCAAIGPDCDDSNFDGHINGTSCCDSLETCQYITNPYPGSAKRPTSIILLSFLHVILLYVF